MAADTFTGTIVSDFYTNGTYTLLGDITLNIFPTSADTIDRTSAHACWPCVLTACITCMHSTQTVTAACIAHAVIQTENENGFYWGPMYNAYETRTTQSCSPTTAGCCSSGMVLTKLVYDTSTSYLCWYPQYTDNAMQIQVRGSHSPWHCLLALSCACMHKPWTKTC